MLLRSKPWYACYDGEGDADAAAAATAAAAAAAAALENEKVTSQAELNAVLKREKEKFRKDREKLAAQLEEHKKNSQLTTEQKEALETQIEELRNANLTVEERARHQLTKAEKDAKVAIETANNQAKLWESRFQDLKIGHEISSAAVVHEVLGNSVQFVEALLRPATRLVPDLDEAGQPTGTFTAKVKFPDVDKDNKPVILDLPVPDAVKRMKELPEKFGNLFKGTANGGLGGGTGTGGKKPNVANMTTAQYMEARKKDPASVGLK